MRQLFAISKLRLRVENDNNDNFKALINIFASINFCPLEKYDLKCKNKIKNNSG